MSTQIVPTNGNGSILARYGDRDAVRELTERYKLMLSGGKKLTDEEARALAQYTVATDLDAFMGECYYMPGVGPGPGVAGWRKKADEQIEYEAKRANEPLGRWWTDYDLPSADEVGQLAAGDIAVKSTLHDTLTKTHWERRYLTALLECRRAGISLEESRAVASELVGPEPVWTAVGVVKASEQFGRDQMSRYERACKRADKAAIKKRFPRIHLPEPAGFNPDVIVDVTPIEPVEHHKRTESELLGDLGFSAPEHPAGVEDGEFTESPDPDFDPAEVAYLDSCDTLSANGKRFGDLKDSDLQYCIDNPARFTAAQVTAARNILDWRKAHAA